jgi:hypothetical protein
MLPAWMQCDTFNVCGVCLACCCSVEVAPPTLAPLALRAASWCPTSSLCLVSPAAPSIQGTTVV